MLSPSAAGVTSDQQPPPFPGLVNHCCSECCLALIQAEADWGKALMCDLEWFRRRSQGWPEVDEARWPLRWHRIKEAPSCFHKAVARAVEGATLDYVLEGLWQKYARRLEIPTAVKARATTDWICTVCKQILKKKANLACHFFKKHGKVALQRLYQGGPTCPSCNKYFHDEYRAQLHIKVNQKCRQFAIQHGYAVPSIGSKQWRQHRHHCPIVCPPLRRSELIAPGKFIGGTGSPRITSTCLFSLGRSLPWWRILPFSCQNLRKLCDK